MTSFSKTLRAKVQDDNFNYMEFYKTINKQVRDLRGIQTSNGGKFVELCFSTFKATDYAESIGIDFKNQHYTLYPVGQRLTFVSTFVPIQFEDEELLTLLRMYGKVKHVRRLFHKDPELSHLENGFRVVAFTELTKPLPKRISYGGISVGFKYTGQPRSCVKCSSFDDEIDECPRRNFKRQMATPTVPDKQQEQNMQTSEIRRQNHPKESKPTETPETPETENETETETDMEIETKSLKRKATHSPTKAEAKLTKKKDPFANYAEFVADLKKERDSSKLLKSPKDLVARARALFLQQELGDVDKADTSTLSFENHKQVLKIWGGLRLKLKPDAKAELIILFNNNFKNNYP